MDGRYKDGAVSFSGVLVTLMSELHYHAEGTLSETGIRFRMDCRVGGIDVVGVAETV